MPKRACMHGNDGCTCWVELQWWKERYLLLARGDLGPPIRLRMWRVQEIEHGALVFFDPRHETIRIFEGSDPELRMSGPPSDPVEASIQRDLFGSRS